MGGKFAFSICPVILRKEATFFFKEATCILSERKKKLPCIIDTDITLLLLIVCEVL